MEYFDAEKHPRSRAGRFKNTTGSPPEIPFPVADIADARTGRYERVSRKFPPGTPWSDPDFWRRLDEMQLSILDLPPDPDESNLHKVRDLAEEMAQQARLLTSVRAIFRAPEPAEQNELDRGWDDLHTRYTRMGEQLRRIAGDNTT